MAEERNMVGLSLDLIIHPGETLAEVIEDRGMSQRELATRTGMTEKHISTVVHGQKNISAVFARKLEYALGIEAAFWMNLQANYDRELLEYEEANSVEEQELSVLDKLKDVINLWASLGWIRREIDRISLLIQLRMLLGISNLLDIPKVPYTAAYCAQMRNIPVDPYILFAWQRTCELTTQGVEVSGEVDIDKLRTRIPEIKQVMFAGTGQIQKKLADVFSECGIAFGVVPGFEGAPVQGFVKSTGKGSLILCVTLRQKYADVFWFTLFHEVAQIINGDTDRVFVDLYSASGASEVKADAVACDFLIDSSEYSAFVDMEEYRKPGAIENFAKLQRVQEYIVRGRLLREKRISWNDRPKYEWA